MITNNMGLPKPLLDAAGEHRKPKLGEVGVTTLIDAPKPRMLRLEHFDDISEDVADRIWAVLGTAVHYILEKADTSNHLSEEFLDIEVLGMKVKGVPDLLDNEGTLSDYKITSVWSLVLGDNKSWERQLNIYAYMYELHGFKVNKLQVVAILRDWQKSKAKYDPEYPQAAVVVIGIPLWSKPEMLEYVQERVRLHQAAENGDIPDCTPEEMWEKPTTWAIYKGANKRAARVLPVYEDAVEYAKEHGYVRIEKRPGERTKCQNYCSVSEHCSQYEEYKASFERI